MPKVVTDLMNSELPELPKNNTNTQQNNTTPNNGVSIYDLIKKQGASKKEQVGVTLSKNIVDKIKTVCIENNMTISRMFEDILTPMLKDVEVNYVHVEHYNKKNKAKGRRVNKVLNSKL